MILLILAALHKSGVEREYTLETENFDDANVLMQSIIGHIESGDINQALALGSQCIRLSDFSDFRITIEEQELEEGDGET